MSLAQMLVRLLVGTNEWSEPLFLLHVDVSDAFFCPFWNGLEGGEEETRSEGSPADFTSLARGSVRD